MDYPLTLLDLIVSPTCLQLCVLGVSRPPMQTMEFTTFNIHRLDWIFNSIENSSLANSKRCCSKRFPEPAIEFSGKWRY